MKSQRYSNRARAREPYMRKTFIALVERRLATMAAITEGQHETSASNTCLERQAGRYVADTKLSD